VQAGQGFGDIAAFALFVSHNADRLPTLYAPLGLIVFLVSLGYTASLGRFQNAAVVLWFLSGFAFLLAGEWVVIVLFGVQITQIFWLTVNGMGVVLGTLLWTVAGEVCEARQAKRLFPLFTSIGILGSVLGNSLTGVLAKLLGTGNLIVVYAVLLAGAFLLLREITRVYFKTEPELLAEYNLANDLRTGFDYVRQSGLFRLVAFSSILYSILFFTVDFPFSQFVSKNFLEDEVKVASFKGLFTSAMTLVTFFVALIIANRLYTRLGIVNSILIMPATYLLGFVVFFIFFRFEVAATFRFAQQVILGGVMGTAWNALFNVVPIERRGQVLAFMNGVPAQVGVILSGLLLIAGTRIFSSSQQILVMGILVAIICFYFTWRMRAEYGTALIAALQAGRVEVFSDEEEAFAGYANDPAVVEATFKALVDPKPFTRRLAVEMLTKMGNPVAVPELVKRIFDDDASVRAEAIKALADLNAKSVIHEIVLGLHDPDDLVREQTLVALPKLEVAASPELIRTLKHLLAEPKVKISARAAVLLSHLGESQSANIFLEGLLSDADPGKRAAALDAYRSIAADANGDIPFNQSLIMESLSDPVPAVRREAMRVAVTMKDVSFYEAVDRHFSDEDAAVRRVASESLKQIWPASRPVVIQALAQLKDVAASCALDSIQPGDAEVYTALRGYIQREVSTIHYLRAHCDSLPQQGRATLLLVYTLKHRESLSEERLIKAVSLFGNPRALDLVRKSLNAGDASTRAAALETLETLGDKRITNEVLPILDRGGMFQAGDDQKMSVVTVINDLLTHEDPWFRAFAAYAVPELKLSMLFQNVRALMTDPVLLVKDAARNAVSRMDGTIMMKKIKNLKTLKTLSTVDRILLLREVPIFTRLAPEDLEKIAEITDEQLFSNQDLLFREGEPGNALYILVSGKVDVIRKTSDGDALLAERGVGDFV
ncbi:MAG TPA: HEAT repeat domain-containing protein, partial [Anaerolineales bacterium]|nr:HEAT repeat domain-containing protein [Anaerolineales bacterium]